SKIHIVGENREMLKNSVVAYRPNVTHKHVP
ncbi:unnamed protein product, partial [marine sediment metagenome]